MKKKKLRARIVLPLLIIAISISLLQCIAEDLPEKTNTEQPIDEKPTIPSTPSNNPASPTTSSQTYANTITVEDLKKHLKVLAADSLLGRLTFTEGEKKAQRYLQEVLVDNQIASPPGIENYLRTFSMEYKEYNYVVERLFPISYNYLDFARKSKEVQEKKALQFENVVAYIEGGDEKLKNEIVIVCAHYDHIGHTPRKIGIFNGADDNASGTSGLLEILEAFQKAKKDGNTPKRSLLFLMLSAEEIGLFGSKRYVNKPLFPLDKTKLVINMDMVGKSRKSRSNEDYVYVIGSNRHNPKVKEVVKEANQEYPKLILDFSLDDKDPDRIYERSDHYPFAEKGVPVVFLTDYQDINYHQTTDTWDKIEYEKLQKRVKLGFHIAWKAAYDLSI